MSGCAVGGEGGVGALREPREEWALRDVAENGIWLILGLGKEKPASVV